MWNISCTILQYDTFKDSYTQNWILPSFTHFHVVVPNLQKNMRIFFFFHIIFSCVPQKTDSQTGLKWRRAVSGIQRVDVWIVLFYFSGVLFGWKYPSPAYHQKCLEEFEWLMKKNQQISISINNSTVYTVDVRAILAD